MKKGTGPSTQELIDHLIVKGMKRDKARELIRERLQLQAELLKPGMEHNEGPQARRLQEINQQIFGA